MSGLNKPKVNNKDLLCLVISLALIIVTYITLGIISAKNTASITSTLFKKMILATVFFFGILLTLFIALNNKKNNHINFTAKLVESEETIRQIKEQATKNAVEIDELYKNGISVGKRLILNDKSWYFNLSDLNNLTEFGTAILDAIEASRMQATYQNIEALDPITFFETVHFFYNPKNN
jgi:hypothetical protein